MTLSPTFLNTLVAEIDSEGITGIILGGSHARGDATPYSDVDIACFVKDKDEEKLWPKRFLYREGRLVSIATKSITGVRHDMARPERAIWVVPGLSDSKILLDKDGSIHELLQEIEAFRWEPLQEAANSYASFNMMMSAELVHKILSELAKGDDSAVAYATAKLFSWLTEPVAVQRGVLVISDNTHYRQVEESVGYDSEWARLHQLVAGIDPTPTRTRGIEALRLYGETLKLMKPVMQAELREVAEQAAKMAERHE